MRLIVIFMAVNIAILSTPIIASQALPGCDEWCGDLRIPYPFGMKEECYLNKTFSINCKKPNNNNNEPPTAFLMDTNISVTKISISGELHVMQPIVRDCYNVPTHHNDSSVPNITSLSAPAIFPVAAAKNKFVAVGCNTLGLIGGELNGSEYVSGCVSVCLNESAIVNGSCSGSGCCQLEIPKGLRNLFLAMNSIPLNYTLDFNPCGYAFVTEDEGFQFSSKYITNFGDEEVGVVLDWGITNQTNYHQCGQNSTRNSSFSDDGSQYRCECFKGFDGNPYLPQGCQGKSFKISRSESFMKNT